MSKYGNTFGRAPDPEEESEEEIRYPWPVQPKEEMKPKTGETGEDPEGAGLYVSKLKALAEQEEAEAAVKAGVIASATVKEGQTQEPSGGLTGSFGTGATGSGTGTNGAASATESEDPEQSALAVYAMRKQSENSQQGHKQTDSIESVRRAEQSAGSGRMSYILVSEGTEQGEASGTFITGKERKKAGSNEKGQGGGNDSEEQHKAGIYTAKAARQKQKNGKQAKGVSNEETDGRESSTELGKEHKGFFGRIRPGKAGNSGNSQSEGGAEGAGSSGSSSGSTNNGTGSDNPLSGNDFYGNSFKTKTTGADNNAFQTSANSEAGSSEGSGVGSFFSLASEEVKDKKNFVKGKTKFARSIGDGDKDGGELAVDSVKEGTRTIRDMIAHIITQIKTIVVLAITLVFGPLAGLIASILSSLIGIIIIIIIAVVILIILAVLGIIALVASAIASIISWFNGDFAGASEMYQYAYQYAEEWVVDVKEEADKHTNTMIMMNGAETTYDVTELYFEQAYIVYLGLGDEATYINSDLELDEDGEESILEDLFEDTDDNKDDFITAFNNLFYFEEDTTTDTFIIHIDNWPYYASQNHVSGMNVYYMQQAIYKDNSVRSDLGMPDAPRYLEVNK